MEDGNSPDLRVLVPALFQYAFQSYLESTVVAFLPHSERLFFRLLIHRAEDLVVMESVCLLSPVIVRTQESRIGT
jgi:hypothetical protein